MVFTLCKSKKIYQSHPTETTVQALNSKSTSQVMVQRRRWVFQAVYVKEGKLPLCCLFVQVWRAPWICRKRASLFIDQPSRAHVSGCENHQRQGRAAHRSDPSALILWLPPPDQYSRQVCVSMCVCYICDVCRSWGRFRLTENLRRVNKQSRAGGVDKCVIMLLDLSAVRSEHLKY